MVLLGQNQIGLHWQFTEDSINLEECSIQKAVAAMGRGEKVTSGDTRFLPYFVLFSNSSKALQTKIPGGSCILDIYSLIQVERLSTYELGKHAMRLTKRYHNAEHCFFKIYSRCYLSHTAEHHNAHIVCFDGLHW